MIRGIMDMIQKPNNSQPKGNQRFFSTKEAHQVNLNVIRDVVHAEFLPANK